MYASLRHYRIEPKNMDELVRRVPGAMEVISKIVDRPFNCGWLSTANLLFKPVSISSFCSADSILPSRPA